MSAATKLSDASAGTCLHLLMSDAADSVDACLGVAMTGDCIILLDQAVGLLLNPAWASKTPPGVNVLVAKADAEARALSRQVRAAELVDDLGWAQLVSRYPHCLSWK